MATRQRRHLRDKLPSYEALAEAMDVKLCPAVCRQVPEQRHWDGFILADDKPTVHWTTVSRWSTIPRGVTRAGIRTFVKLAYRAKNGSDKPAWQRLYEENMAAYAMAAVFGFRYDRKIFEDDKARLRFLLRDPQDRQGELAQAAWRWAEKRYD